MKKLLWIFLVIVLLIVFYRKEGYYVYSGQLDQEYEAQHPYRGRVSSTFSYSSPSEWRFNNFDKTTSLNVPGVGNVKGMVGVEEKICPNVY
jgi:hypothetical protein